MTLRNNWIYILVVSLVTGLLLLLPSPIEHEERMVQRVQVRVETVDNSLLDPLGLVFTGVQACTARIMDGKYKG